MDLVKEEIRQIKLEDLQRLLDYLQRQPYCDVHELVQMIIITANK